MALATSTLKAISAWKQAITTIRLSCTSKNIPYGKRRTPRRRRLRSTTGNCNGCSASASTVASTASAKRSPSSGRMLSYQALASSKSSFASGVQTTGSVSRHMSNLREQINSLSPAEKAELLDTVWESLEADAVSLTDAQRAELDYKLLLGGAR